MAKTVSGLPSEQAETAQFPVRIAPLIGQKEPVRRQMQNARRAASLEARFFVQYPELAMAIR